MPGVPKELGDNFCISKCRAMKLYFFVFCVVFTDVSVISPKGETLRGGIRDDLKSKPRWSATSFSSSLVLEQNAANSP